MSLLHYKLSRTQAVSNISIKLKGGCRSHMCDTFMTLNVIEMKRKNYFFFIFRLLHVIYTHTRLIIRPRNAFLYNRTICPIIKRVWVYINCSKVVFTSDDWVYNFPSISLPRKPPELVRIKKWKKKFLRFISMIFSII